ncbi:hypothetical protein JRQ81_010925, partial [Phrynocephalus forsythii]
RDVYFRNQGAVPRATIMTAEGKQPTTNKGFLPCIKGVMDRMDKVLKNNNLQTGFRPTTKKYNRCYGQQRTKRNQPPLQEYTGYLVVVARYILGPQSAASRPESKSMKNTAD